MTYQEIRTLLLDREALTAARDAGLTRVRCGDVELYFGAQAPGVVKDPPPPSKERKRNAVDLALNPPEDMGGWTGGVELPPEEPIS